MTAATTTPDRAVPARLTGGRRSVREVVFTASLWASLLVGIAFLAILLVYVVVEGWDRLDSRLWLNMPSVITPGTAGAQSAIMGTFWVITFTGLYCVPTGVMAAIYLEEYANPGRWYNRLIELNIQNLAAVPSVIYGILALAFVVRAPLNLGAVALSAAIALAFLILPIIIISSREALRAVPREIRDGSLALGATQWQTIWRQVLPASIPGIATGTILGVSRAVGEAAPVILVGAATFITFNPTPLSQFTVMPVQIYGLVAQPNEASKMLAYSAILLLILILLALNAVAIYLRNRFQQRW
ncbi:MAG: phosphate ABC transporter permease PstA [Actinomycetes bacterium]